MTKKVSVLSSVLLLGVAVLYPFETTVVPSKRVLVITDEGQRPIQGAKVRQIWQHYSLESEGHEDNLYTDENGRVTFPDRTIRASLLRRIGQPVWYILSGSIHASFGVHTNILELGGGSERLDSAKMEAGGEEIVFRRR